MQLTFDLSTATAVPSLLCWSLFFLSSCPLPPLPLLLRSPIAILHPCPPSSYSVLQMTFTDSALRYCTVVDGGGTCVYRGVHAAPAEGWGWGGADSMRKSTNQSVSVQDFKRVSCPYSGTCRLFIQVLIAVFGIETLLNVKEISGMTHRLPLPHAGFHCAG